MKISIEELAKKKPKTSAKAISDFIAKEENEFREASKRCLLVGNLQITHVMPEVTAKDLELEFDSSLFMQRCKWCKKKPKLYYLIKNMNSGFYIYGETGSGKTTFLKAKALEVGKTILTKADGSKDSMLLNKDFVKFVNFGKVIQEISKEGFIFRPYIINELVKCTHLFIDDLGTEKGTTFHEEILTMILDSRLFKDDKNGIAKTTSFSSNRTPEQLPYHPRLIRRFNDIAKVIQVADMDKAEPAATALKDNPSNS